ncbi:MAG: hypothetical protein J6K95_03400 [Rikenellaceae bacterium]|nr:hypothetical protein [Rikenellaceae bacterium]
MKQLLFILLTFLLLTGCNRKEPAESVYVGPPVFEEEREGDFVFPSKRDIAAQRVFALFPYKDYIVAFGAFYGHFIEVYDKQSGGLVSRGVSQGRGPGEVVWAEQADLNPFTGVMTMYDDMTRTVMTFDIDDLIWSQAEYEKHPAQRWAMGEYQLDPSHRLVNSMVSLMGMEPAKRMVVWRDSVQTAVYHEFPIRDSVTNINYEVYQQSRFSLSPDRTKAVSGTLIARSVVEMFEVSPDAIRCRYAAVFHGGLDPELKREERGNVRYGFASLYAGDDMMLGVLDTSQPGEKWRYNALALFDWNGKGLMKIQTPYRDCAPACLDYDGKTVYAVVRAENDFWYLGKMEIE